MKKYYKSKAQSEYPIYNERKEDSLIGNILRKICLLKQVIEGKIQGKVEVKGRRERRRRQLLDDLRKRR
jgi:hypothetical protein